MAGHDHERDDKGEKLPGLAGAVQTIVGSKPVAAMLTPAAEVFGEHLRKRAIEKVAEWEAKRRDNIREHKRRVHEVTEVTFPDDPSESQAEFAFEWAQQAQHIDPEIHPDLAALWECLFAKISKNSPDARRLMAALKQLEPDDARLLLRRGQERFKFSVGGTASRDRMFAAGIIDYWFRPSRSTRRKAIRAISMLLVGAAVVGTFDRWFQDGNPITRVVLAAQSWLTNIPLVTLIWLLALVFTLYIYLDATVGWYRLTDLGKELRQQGYRFRETRKRS